MKKKFLIGILCAVLASGTVLFAACGSGGGTGGVKEIVIDGGGDIGNFNTTASMTQSEANPFPYNTLETLCKEWELKNPGYKVTINKTSNGGDRGTMVPLLNNKRAPDISYQNGTVIYTDLGKGYYVDMKEYLNQPNPYVLGNEKWRDIYVAEELNTTVAPDGGIYYIDLEKIPVGIMYNENILKAAGVTVDGTPNTEVKLPTTYGEFMDAQVKIKASGKEAYMTTYNWYDIVLESSLFSDLLPELDVLRPNGQVDTEELVRGYVKGIWNPSLNAGSKDDTFENNLYYEYIKLAAEKAQYYPENWQSYDSNVNFVNGNIAFIEGTGQTFRKLSINKNIDFEFGVMPYPDLTKEDTPNAGKGVVRGTAGLGTSWFVTNSAEKKGTVEGCVDLLMFLTAPENNNRLIGDLKGGIPLNPAEDTVIAPYLQGMLNVYNEDAAAAKDGERVYWGAINSWAVLGYSYNTAFIKNMQDIYNGTKTIKEAAFALAGIVKNTCAALQVEYEYDTSKW